MSNITVDSMNVYAKVVALASICVKVVAGVLGILMYSSCTVMHGEITHACVLLPIVLSNYISDDL